MALSNQKFGIVPQLQLSRELVVPLTTEGTSHQREAHLAPTAQRFRTDRDVSSHRL
jgi:hypothetical protein